MTNLIKVDFTTDGYAAIKFMQGFCRYPEGPKAGQLLQLLPFQQLDILEIFRTDPKTGIRVYRTALWGRPRKNSKTTDAAGLALFSLVADKTIGAQVFSASGDRDQARICFDAACRMVKLEPELSAVLNIRDAQATITHPSSNSVYRAVSADSDSFYGYNPSFTVFDEVWTQPSAKLWTAVTSGSGMRLNAMCLGISTAGFDKSTLCGKLYKMGKEKKVKSFYMHWLEPADENCDWLDERVWLEVNPLLAAGIANMKDFRDEAEVAKSRGAENEFRRLKLNQWTGSIEAWLPYGSWPAIATDHPIEIDEPCILGFDGSFSGDSTALVCCTIPTERRPIPYIEAAGVWEKPEGVDGADWRVPQLEVEKAIIEFCKTHLVKEVACDPYRWQRSMAVLEEAGIPIVEFLTTSPLRMVRATALFYDMVRDQTLEHAPLSFPGMEALAKHLDNAYIRTDMKGPRLSKENKASTRHIDMAVAAVCSLDRAMNQEVEEEVSFGIW